MNASRRTFFGLLGAAPIVIKQAGDKAVADLARIDLAPSGACMPSAVSEAGLSSSIRQRLINQFRPEFESLIYQQKKRVGLIDADISVHKSFSMNAMIAFQRQRNVASEMDQQETGFNQWSAVGRFFADKAKSFVGM